VLFFFFFNVFGYATTVIVVITSKEIVVGSDGKQTATVGDGTPRGTSMVVKKAELVANNRIVVATAGVAQIGGYEFSPWIKGIGHGLRENISVKDFVLLLEKESAAKFALFDRGVLAQGLLTHPPGEYCRSFVQYLVVGYENSKPWVYLVKFYIDWDRKHLVGPKTIILHPSEINSTDADLISIGDDDALKDILNGNSYAYKQAARTIPKTFAKYLAAGDFDEPQAVELIRTLIHIEEEVVPSEVGGLGQFFRIPVRGAGSVIGPKRGDARKTLAKPAHSAANK
jgi:hypothetical protein